MMLKKILGYRCSSATLGDNGKLVLSLENALTPVMWIIDLNESPSLLFKVTETDDNLFVLQKLIEGAKGRTVEDLAFYNKKAHAMNAMEQASTAMTAQTRHRVSSGAMRAFRFILNTAAILVVLFAVILFLRIDLMVLDLIDSVTNTQSMTESNTTEQPNIQPSSNPNDVGVPLSADDFFNNQQGGQSSGLPF